MSKEFAGFRRVHILAKKKDACSLPHFRLSVYLSVYLYPSDILSVHLCKLTFLIPNSNYKIIYFSLYMSNFTVI